MRGSLITLLLVMLLMSPAPAWSQQHLKISTKQIELLQNSSNYLRELTGESKHEIDRTQKLFYEKAVSLEQLVSSLTSPLESSKDAIQKTEMQFLEVSESDQIRNEGRMFFGSILIQHDLVLKEIAETRDSSDKFPRMRDSAIFTVETAALALSVVAHEGFLTFDLDVKSEPEVGVVSYKRIGDSYKQAPDPTNTVIPNLVYAIWMVRVQKQGYKDQEKPHDPFREKNHVMFFVLEKQ